MILYLVKIWWTEYKAEIKGILNEFLKYSSVYAFVLFLKIYKYFI